MANKLLENETGRLNLLGRKPITKRQTMMLPQRIKESDAMHEVWKEIEKNTEVDKKIEENEKAKKQKKEGFNIMGEYIELKKQKKSNINKRKQQIESHLSKIEQNIESNKPYNPNILRNMNEFINKLNKYNGTVRMNSSSSPTSNKKNELNVMKSLNSSSYSSSSAFSNKKKSYTYDPYASSSSSSSFLNSTHQSPRSGKYSSNIELTTTTRKLNNPSSLNQGINVVYPVTSPKYNSSKYNSLIKDNYLTQPLLSHSSKAPSSNKNEKKINRLISEIEILESDFPRNNSKINSLRKQLNEVLKYEKEMNNISFPSSTLSNNPKRKELSVVTKQVPNNLNLLSSPNNIIIGKIQKIENRIKQIESDPSSPNKGLLKELKQKRKARMQELKNYKEKKRLLNEHRQKEAMKHVNLMNTFSPFNSSHSASSASSASPSVSSSRPIKQRMFKWHIILPKIRQVLNTEAPGYILSNANYDEYRSLYLSNSFKNITDADFINHVTRMEINKNRAIRNKANAIAKPKK